MGQATRFSVSHLVRGVTWVWVILIIGVMFVIQVFAIIVRMVMM